MVSVCAVAQYVLQDHPQARSSPSPITEPDAVTLMPADEAQEVGEEDELEAMFKPKKKRRQERDQADKKSIVEELLARMEVRRWRLGLLQYNPSNVPCAELLHDVLCLVLRVCRGFAFLRGLTNDC